jgi:uncharacterized protein (TIGR03435 family)
LRRGEKNRAPGADATLENVIGGRTAIRISLLATAAALGARQMERPPESFEVASIKAAKDAPAEGSTSFEVEADRLTVRNYPFVGILTRAYSINPSLIQNPAALPAGRYDIDAKAGHACTRAAMMEMLRTLLAERFKLAMHRESRNVSGYALLVDAGGAKLHDHSGGGGDCTTHATPAGVLRFENCAMPFFAVGLSQMAGDRPVADRTGLGSAYDFELLASWELPANPMEPTQEPRVIHPGAPSVFTALRQQLGLRLQPERIAVDFYRVDRVEKLIGNE